ncbi:hypothetical protein H632_c1304p0 [Helicosporidium sp. ATCC 50920]|nr:hypothetical protein H632_c1304p0 [Helicosporidium sp. ATCC 50920]|eukprot:KDD74449.1 hypothetical protein H632_c1304p0 [Helicosporidium sp. ATCC 50920]
MSDKEVAEQAGVEDPLLLKKLEQLSPQTRDRALHDPHLMHNLRRLHGTDGIHAVLQSDGGGYPHLERVSAASQHRIAQDPNLMHNLRRMYGADGVHAILQSDGGGYPDLARQSPSGRVLSDEEIHSRMTFTQLELLHGKEGARRYMMDHMTA